MKKLAASVLAVGAIAAIGAAPASAGVDRLAKQDCLQERSEDPLEFEARFGGMGEAAVSRCVRVTKREAKADCKQERRFETAEFELEYGGTDKAALNRCIKDELR